MKGYTVPLEDHLRALNTLIALALLVVVTPLPRRPDVRWWVVVPVSGCAFVVGVALQAVGALAISASHPDPTLAKYPNQSWNVDAYAPQWIEVYVLWGLAGVFVCLASRLLFTRGVRRVWSAVAAAGAVMCVAGAMSVWATG